MKTLTKKPVILEVPTITSNEAIVLPPEYLDVLTEMTIERIKKYYILVKKKSRKVKKAEQNPMSKEARIAFIENAIRHTCKYFEVTREEICSSSKASIRGSFFTLAEMRYFAMRMCRRLPRYPIGWQFIGDALGKRSHSTIFFGVQRLDGLIETSPDFKRAYDEIEALVKISLSRK